MAPVVQFKKGIFYANTSYDQKKAREALKAAGFRFCWGVSSGKCWAKCPACRAGLPAYSWHTRDLSIAGRFYANMDANAKAAVDQSKAAEAASRATDVAVPTNFNVDCPDGREYLPYQKAGIEWIVKRQSTLLGDEMGLGKTIQVLGAINADPQIRKVLVVCPATLRRNWVAEATRWITKPLQAGIVQQAGDLPAHEKGKVLIVVTNFERLTGKRGEALLGELKNHQWDMLIIDEAHKVKNPKAQRTLAVIGNRQGAGGLAEKAFKKVYLTGTPIANKPVELWGLISSLDPQTWRNFMYYAKRYCAAEQVWAGRKMVWDFSGAQNLEELQRRLRTENGGLMIRRLKKDVLTELPAKRRVLTVLEPNGASGVIAKEQAAWEKVQEQVDLARAALLIAQEQADKAAYEEAVKNLQACTRVAFEEIAAARRDTAVAKIPHAVEHLRDMLEDNQEKVVVFAHHHAVVDGIMEGLAEFGPVRLTGKDSDQAKNDAVKQFQENPTCRVFVGNILAAGVGITLTASSNVVFAELDYVPANMSQAEDRCHRIGQKDSVLVQHLVLDGSLDQRMAATLIKKQAICDGALDAQLGNDPIYLDDSETGPGRRPPQYTKDTHDAALEAIRTIAGYCDGAASRDNAGFSKFWTKPGKWLAAKSELTDRQVALVIRIAGYHHRQLTDDQLAKLGITRPTSKARKVSKTK